MDSIYCRFLDNVLVPKSWGGALRQMTDEDAWRVIKALFKFMDGGSPDLEFRLKIVFNVMAQQIEQSARRYCYKAGLLDGFWGEYEE